VFASRKKKSSLKVMSQCNFLVETYIYKGSFIISETGAVIWSKLTLGLLATITLEAVPFHASTILNAS
jgi:hypothetical protein